MIPPLHLKATGQSTQERFITTYSSDYRPFSGRHLQVNQLKPRAGYEAALAFSSPPQTKRETWPVFYQYLYKTTNSTYGSFACAQPPSCYLFPASLCHFGVLAPSVSTAARVVGSTLTEGGTQDTRVAWEMGHPVGVEEKGQLHCVCGEKANVLRDAEDDPMRWIDILYKDDAIVVSFRVVPACCEDFLGCVCREAGLQHLLHLPPVASTPVITKKDAEHWENSSFLRGLRNSTVLQLASRQCNSCIEEIEQPKSHHFKTRTLPHHAPQFSNLPTICCTEPSKKPLLSEYQASYSAEWPQSKIQVRDNHHRHLPCRWNPHPSP